MQFTKAALLAVGIAWSTHGVCQDSIRLTPDSLSPQEAQAIDQEPAALDTSLLEYEADWLDWLSTHHCSSSDTVLLNIRDYAENEVPALDTAELKSRMSLLSASSPMDLDWNPVVHSRIRFYASKRRKHLGKMLGRAPAYFPIFEQALDRHDLPMELKYLPVVESGLNPTARSHAGARGLWQFMYATAQYQGLRIDSYIDERRDPYRSSEAACAFLSKLYNTYGDWFLALAAYNAGPGNVNRAIRRSGGKRNFWEIRFYLPRETRNYVPAFMAVVYLMEYHLEHNIYPVDVRPPHALLDTVTVNEVLRFDQIAEAVGLNPSDVSHLNPMYRLDVIPATVEQWPLVLPSSKIPLFMALQDSVKNIKPELTPDIVFVPEPVTYRVKNGDVLGKIADRYGVSVRQLREWNDLSGSMIRIGQKLLIHANPKSY